jgi:hypothetical protein
MVFIRPSAMNNNSKSSKTKTYRSLRARKARNSAKPSPNRRSNREGLSYDSKFHLHNRGLVLPEIFRTNMYFREQVNFSATTTPQIYIFRGNSVYDPDQTGTGSAAQGVTTLSTWYGNYYINASRITVTLYNSTTQTVQAALVPTLSASTISTYDQAMLYKRQLKIGQASGTSRGGNPWCIVTNTAATRDIYGQSLDIDLRSGFTSNPNAQWYWTLALQTADQSTTITCSIQVEVIYDVQFTQPKVVGLG